MTYPGGITDRPPTTYTGTQLFRWWLDDGRPCEADAPDGSFVLRHAELDFDYLMGYLLEVRSGEGGRMSDYLFCFQRHGGSGDIVTEWLNEPREVGDPETHNGASATHRWVDWCYGEVERYGEVARERLKAQRRCFSRPRPDDQAEHAEPDQHPHGDSRDH